MNFLKRLFGQEPKKPKPTDDELNLVFVPLRDAVLGFKDKNGISWTVILPAMQKMHVRLLVEKQGLLATRLQYEVMLRGLEQAHGISIGMVRRLEIPDFPQEQIVLVNIFLLETASVLMARGFPVDHVAQAFAAFAVLTGERVAGETYVLAMLRETYEAIQPGNFS